MKIRKPMEFISSYDNNKKKSLTDIQTKHKYFDVFIETILANKKKIIALDNMKELTKQFPEDRKYAFEERNGILVKQYSSHFTEAFNKKLNGMIERRMRQSIHAVASFWYTAWINAGQPDLHSLSRKTFTTEEIFALDSLNVKWKIGSGIIGREE